MLRVEHLRIGQLPPLSFAVAGGECLAIEGPSGSGKTRILRAIADLDPVEGHLFIDGSERAEVPATASGLPGFMGLLFAAALGFFVALLASMVLETTDESLRRK